MDIGVWGASITYGEGDEQALGWVGRLRKHLNEAEHFVYNRGVCGDTTADVLQRFEVEVTSVEPDMVVFAVGTNDTKSQSGDDENNIPSIPKKGLLWLINSVIARM